jgi:hypothetical protein
VPSADARSRSWSRSRAYTANASPTAASRSPWKRPFRSSSTVTSRVPSTGTVGPDHNTWVPISSTNGVITTKSNAVVSVPTR